MEFGIIIFESGINNHGFIRKNIFPFAVAFVVCHQLGNPQIKDTTIVTQTSRLIHKQILMRRIQLLKCFNRRR